MQNNNSFGDKGENLAKDFLQKNGYEILETNWYYGHREIDIIAKINQTLVVVEVKSRSANFIEAPVNAVNRKKQKLLIEAINAYITQNNIDFEIRFDIISVIAYGKTYKIEHIQDAFYPLV